MSGKRLGVAVLVIASACLGAGRVQASARPAAVAPTAAGLRALLAGAGVPLLRGTHPSAASFDAAWTAFRQFSRLPAGGRGGDLAFEFGVFESKDYGTSFEVELTRSYAGARKVHLLVHFPVSAFIAITRRLRATPCLPGRGCTFRCFFAGDEALVPHPCRIASPGTGGYEIGDMTLRASQAGGRSPWLAGIEASPVFTALLARHVRPDGYEVWQE